MIDTLTSTFLLLGIDEDTAEHILASFYRQQQSHAADEGSVSPLKVSLLFESTISRTFHKS